MRRMTYVALLRGRRATYRASVGKQKAKRLLGRPRRRWGIILERIINRLEGR
jgi:hypothetical protein